MSAAGTLQAAKRHGWRETVSRGSARQGIWKRQEDVAVWAQPLIRLLRAAGAAKQQQRPEP